MKSVQRVITWLVTAGVPFFILMTAVRILINPWFPQVEYRMPGFPEDTYGMTLGERQQWSQPAIAYLVNSEGISFLGDLTFRDGTPLYNERELAHMLDVKNLVQGMIKAWWILGIFLVGVGLLSWRTGWMADFWLAVGRGGWGTLGLIGVVLAGVLLSFDELFTGFHQIFFSGDSWLFYYSDTLIRLFPMRFWQDAFIFTGAVSIGFGILLGLLGRKLSK
jgi:integral membrane protein (TIGR01906 family)